MGKSRLPWCAALLVLVIASGGGASEAAGRDGVGLDARPGTLLPLDTLLSDDTGARLRLGDLTGRPLLLSFVSFSCTRQCPLVLGGLAEALGRLGLRPGEDYAVATVSIDEGDTPADAAAAKRNYLAAVGRPFPADAWKFLTGDAGEIGRLTDAVGLRYQRHGEHLFHPVVLLAVAPGGRIASVLPVGGRRYETRARVSFQPAQLETALTDAGRGLVGRDSPAQVLYCFPFERDPERSFYAILKVFGAVNLLALGALLAFLVRGKRGPGAAERG